MKDLIRKIIKEETSLSEKLRNAVLKKGWKIAAKMIGFDKMYEIAFDNDYHNFLELYSNLTPETKENSSYEHYCLNNSYCPLLYYKPENTVMISEDKIWSFFSKGLDYDINKTRKILKNWVENTYGLEFNYKHPFHPYSTVAPDEHWL